MSGLIDAVKSGNLEIVKQFVSTGADIRFNIDLAVRMASCEGYLEIVKYLVSLGADIRSYNDSAIRFADDFYNFEVVKYLYEQGADISYISENAMKYIAFCQKMEEKKRHRAQKRIYFWWIPICYDISRACGQRMKLKNWEATYKLLQSS